MALDWIYDPEMSHRMKKLGSDLHKIDTHKITLQEYEDIPELTCEWFKGAELHMSKKPSPMELPREYGEALSWILLHRAGGKRPPETIEQVTGWIMTRFTAYVFRRHNVNVARDLIDMHTKMERGSLEASEFDE